MTTDFLARPSPHSPETEQALLGSLLLSPQSIASTAGQIGPDDFHDLRNCLVFRTLEEMVADNQPVDLVTVTERLRVTNRIDEVGGAAYVTALFNATPTATSLNFHIESVRNLSTLRKTITFADTLRDQATNSPDKPAALLENARQQLDIIARASGIEGGNMRHGMERSLVDATALRGMAVEPREYVVWPFFKQGDLGFIFGKRGEGKTWLTLLLARAAATGGGAGPWKAEQRNRVLYVDGEMPAEETKRRDCTLGADAGCNLTFLHHEVYFERTSRTLNLADPTQQNVLTQLLVEGNFRVLILDNLSCLFSGVRENDADDWELVLPWLLKLRRLKIAVVIVAHAGRNGQMRGTSRREDQAFWVIKLERSDSNSDGNRGLRFTSVFTKNRNAQEEDCPPLEWMINEETNGAVSVTTKPVSGIELLTAWVNAGLDSASDIAQEMGVSKGQVSKLAKKAEVAGYIKIENRRYLPVVERNKP